MRGQPTRPLPVPNALTQPFWDAAKNRQLAIQRCQNCKLYSHPPLPVCNQCFSNMLAYEQVSGRGRIFSRTVMHDPRILGFGETVVPYEVITVELDEQPGLLLIANLLGAGPEEAAIGRRVEVDFEPLPNGMMLPQFRLSDKTRS